MLYDAAELAELWQNSEDRLLAFVSNGSIGKFEQLVGKPLKILSRTSGTIVIANRLRPGEVTEDDLTNKGLARHHEHP